MNSTEKAYLRTLILGLATFAGSAQAFDMSLGFGYSQGNQLIGGAPVIGYGAAGYGLAGVGGACGQMAGYLPPALPPIPGPVLPGWGGVYGSYPGPWAQPGMCGVPCGAGLVPQPVIAVPGGPLLANGNGYGLTGSLAISTGNGMNLSNGRVTAANGSGVNFLGSGVIEIGERNEWEKSDTSNIILATALGMGMQASTVTPVTCFRNEPTLIPSLYNSGDRNFNFTPRPHAGP